MRFVSLHLILHIQDMVCQKKRKKYIWVSTSLGVIHTLKMSSDGNTVDLAKCAARYASFGSADGRHDTHQNLSLPLCVCVCVIIFKYAV